jgi:Uncharacterized protein conserved in bacteria (DUF2330)
MSLKALYLAPLSLTLVVLLVPAERAAGCAVAPPFGESVRMADESAIIIWDAATKTQHFIRRATFSSSARDFGFLVPTPTKPELAEAGDEGFNALAGLTEPRIVTQSAPSGGGGCGCGSVMSPMIAGSAHKAEQTVDVLESKRVAGYDAVVLQADNAGELSKWLKDHGYESSPALTEWVEPYVKKGWKITAFKIARDDAAAPAGTAKTGPATARAPGEAQMSTSAVRMTFHTEHPFFPYREPPGAPPATSGPNPERLLRVYFVAAGRVKGTLGEGGKPWGDVARARVVWANKLVDANRDSVLRQLKLSEETPPASWWLTEFEDHSSPRPGTDDVYFSLDEDQSTVERPPIVQYVSANLPGCVMCYALALYLFLPRLLRRRR